VRLDLAEGRTVEVALTSGQVHALTGSGAVRLSPAATPGRWRVAADTNKVGVVRVGRGSDEVEVRIRPKLPVARLLFLLGYARRLNWRPEQVGVEEHPDLLPALAAAFARAAERALRQGPLQGYQYCEEALPVVRGRIRVVDQVRRRHGLLLPVEAAFDDFTVDTAENRLLLAAARRLLRLPGVPAPTRSALRRLQTRLAGVAPLVPGRPLPAWHPSRLNTRYHTALGLAEVILRGGSVELAPGPVRVDGLLVDMAAVFEDFVTAALAEALARYGLRVRPQDRRHALDVAGRVRIRPDLVVEDHTGRTVGVADAKYKAERPGGFPDADLYQALAYATALGLPEAHLVYAAGDEQPARHTVRNAGVELVCHALDLAAQPDSLLTQVRAVADKVAGPLVGGHAASG
jgi:5-methylcytosine-specific restriction enzyme subunit McrC